MSRRKEITITSLKHQYEQAAQNYRDTERELLLSSDPISRNRYALQLEGIRDNLDVIEAAIFKALEQHRASEDEIRAIDRELTQVLVDFGIVTPNADDKEDHNSPRLHFDDYAEHTPDQHFADAGDAVMSLRVFVSRSPDIETNDRLYTDICFALNRLGHTPVFRDIEMISGKEWLADLLPLIQQSHGVIVLWKEHSDWILIEAALAEFLGKPLLFVCYEGSVPPEPFSHRTKQYGNDLSAGSVVSELESLVENAVSTFPMGIRQTVEEFGEKAFTEAFLEELKRELTLGTARRSRFEKKFEIGLDAQELYKRQLILVRELLKQDFERVPEGYPFDEYRLRYDLGLYLGELEGVSTSELLTTTIVQAGKRDIEVMVYLVTEKLMHEYRLAAEATVSGRVLDPTKYYLPYAQPVGTLTNNWFDELQSFIKWLSVTKFDHAPLRLPTFQEWQSIAGPIEQWNMIRLTRCNLDIGHNRSAAMSAVGVFSDGQSNGCHDVIGNVWELVQEPHEPTPQYVAGWSYLMRNVSSPQAWGDLRARLPRGLHDKEPIGFRLVVER